MTTTTATTTAASSTFSLSAWIVGLADTLPALASAIVVTWSIAQVF